MTSISIGGTKFRKALTLDYPTLKERFKLACIPTPPVTLGAFVPGVASLIGGNSYLRCPSFIATCTYWHNDPFPYLIGFKLEKDYEGTTQIIVTNIYFGQAVEAFKDGMCKGMGRSEWASKFGEARDWAKNISQDVSEKCSK